MPRLSVRHRLLLASLWFEFACLATAQGRGPDADRDRFFENEVRPVLAARCVSCHGPQKSKGGLRLDSLAAALQGGSTGPAVVPNDLEQSLVVEAVRREGLEMPPDGPLPPEEAEAIVRWVEMGAPWPGPGGPDGASAAPADRGAGDPFTAEDREYWVFQPVRDSVPPNVEDDRWNVNPIDRFVADRLTREGLKPSAPADRRTLIRRLSFDLIGLPPTPEEVDVYVDDPESDEVAYGRLVERLLESPRYGERWGRHWLDLVRYAESNGYRADEYRPDAWRYRDYVIDRFNRDVPYDQFIREQIAGDELMPGEPLGKVATGYLRLWIYESNQRDVKGQWDAILADVTDVTSDVFLGLGLQCARCHDHKYDPLLQRDYYRLQAFFAPIVPVEDGRLSSRHPIRGDDELEAAWMFATRGIRQQLDELIAEQKRSAARDAVAKFQPDMKAMIDKPARDRTPLERQLTHMAYRQVQLEFDKIEGALKGAAKSRYNTLKQSLSWYDDLRPDLGQAVETITDVGSEPPETLIPGDRSRTSVQPGFLSILNPEPAEIGRRSRWPETTGRRSALASWLTDPSNPMVARVMVNRVWQHHFGRGLVESSSDFGRLGDPPTHPELLDWLASRFVEDGWSIKALHRRILCSETYRQGLRNADAEHARLVDPSNILLWRMPVRRLESEVIRDALLSVSGELDTRPGGPGVEATKPKRSIYVKVMRNKRDPLFDAFDGPDGYFSTSNRNTTTTPTQSLLMINGRWVLDRARAFARRLMAAPLDDAGRVDLAHRLAYGRAATAEEIDDAIALLSGRDPASDSDSIASACEKPGGPYDEQAWTDLAHVLLNASEFLYVD